MKQITLVFALVMLCATIAFSQNTNTKKATPEKRFSPEMKQADKDGTLHYSYNNGKLTNCMGNKWNAQLQDIKLKSGIVLTRKGVVKYKDGTKGQLKDGECIDLMGNITGHKEAHQQLASGN